MGLCKVTFTDSDAVDHSAKVEANSFYEAVALAVVEFREDPLLSEAPNLHPVHCRVMLNPTEHKIRLNRGTGLGQDAVRRRADDSEPKSGRGVAGADLTAGQ